MRTLSFLGCCLLLMEAAVSAELPFFVKESDRFTIGVSDGRFFGSARMVPNEVRSPGWVEISYERMWRSGTRALDRKGTIWINVAQVTTVNVYAEEDAAGKDEDGESEMRARLQNERDRLIAEYESLKARVQDETLKPSEREILRAQAIRVGARVKELEQRLKAE